MTLQERLDNVRKRKADGVEFLKGLLAEADKEGRDLSKDEEANFSYIDKEVERLKVEETRIEKLANDDLDVNTPKRRVQSYIRPNQQAQEFKNLGEWLFHVRFFPNDERLQYQEFEREERQQSMGVGVEGGFAVPTQFIPTLRMVDPQVDIFRPRSTVIPPGDPPDAMVSMPTLDQTAAQNIYGGMTVTWIAEGATKPETDLRLLEVCLTPHEIAAHTIITDKLLRNWAAAGPLVEQMLRLCVRGAEDTAFYSGTGVGQPLGVLNSPARINVARAGAGAIVIADINNMYAQLKMGGSPVWIASQTILPQLVGLIDAGNHLIWMPNATGVAGTPPGTLYGIPLVFNDRSVALGTAGDLILCDLSYYLIKDGSGPFVATSPHVHFTTNRTVVKIFWNVDGQPWLSAPIPLEGSVANTVSPFIVLN